MPDRFRPVTALYLQSYAERASDVYGTLRTKRDAIARFWRYLDSSHPAVQDSSEVTPTHGTSFITFVLHEAARVRRTDDTTTAYAWLVDVRTFFADLIDWAAEPGSPFAGLAPAVPPLTRNDLSAATFVRSRRRRAAKTQATVLDLEREMPKIRAYALRMWNDASQEAASDPRGTRAARGEFDGVLGLGGAGAAGPERAAGRGGVGADDPGRAQAPPCRWTGLLHAARQALEV
jgi:hypothetical protein